MSWFARTQERRPITLRGEIDRESDGRWIAEITDLPGVMVYGETREEAKEKAFALALRVLADRVEHHEVSSREQLSVDLCLQDA